MLSFNYLCWYVSKLDVHKSVHRDTTIKITNKMHYIDQFIIPSQLYIFRAMLQSSSPDDGRKHRPKHVELTWNNKLIYLVHLVGYFHSYIC